MLLLTPRRLPAKFSMLDFLELFEVSVYRSLASSDIADGAAGDRFHDDERADNS